MLQIKKALVWSLITGIVHPSINEKEEMKILALMPILATLFPGVNYYSITGFSTLMHKYGIPALKKLFSEIKNLKGKDINVDEMLVIKEAFLPSKGYEWQNDPNWALKFTNLAS